MEPKFPNIKVKLVGEDGNAFAILGRVQRAMRTNGVSREVTNQYMEEATHGDYNNLLSVTAKWVTVL